MLHGCTMYVLCPHSHSHVQNWTAHLLKSTSSSSLQRCLSLSLILSSHSLRGHLASVLMTARD